MLWSTTPELALCLGLIMVILYGLFSLRNQHVYLADVSFFCRAWPLLLMASYLADGSGLMTTWYDLETNGIFYAPGLDCLLCVLTVVILKSFKSFESVLLLMMAFVGQLFMLHSCDLVSFYVCLEAQNFCFLVLCGLQPNAGGFLNQNQTKQANNTESNNSTATENATGTDNATSKVTDNDSNNNANKEAAKATATATATTHFENENETTSHNNNVIYSSGSSVFSVEASLKYLLLSAFSSGVILFWFSNLYLRTGMSVLFFKSTSFDAAAADTDVDFSSQLESFQILLAMMFKLGAAPLHLWVVDIYGGVKRQLLMYVSTAPKLSLFGFWVSAWHQVWTDFSVAIFIVFSLVLGSFGAYGQPALRTLLAYSTISEIGILLMAIESAGFHSLFQHLSIYIVTQLLLWNLSDKRLFSLIAVSLAGLPPLSGFFTKAFIFWHVANQQLYFLLFVALFSTGIALVYYLRIVRLFWTSHGLHGNHQLNGTSTNNNNTPKTESTGQILRQLVTSSHRSIALSSNSYLVDQSQSIFNFRFELTSVCVIILIFAPLFLLKPFVL